MFSSCLTRRDNIKIIFLMHVVYCGVFFVCDRLRSICQYSRLIPNLNSNGNTENVLFTHPLSTFFLFAI